MKVVIAGGRDVWPTIAEIAQAVAECVPEMTVLVVGLCETGVDEMALRWARKHGIPIMGFPANWGKYGGAGGPIRNRIMAAEGDVLIAFPGSHGTANMIAEAERLHKPIYKREIEPQKDAWQ